MDRYGLFVDAGYLFAEAGGLCAGTKRRSELRCDDAGLVEELRALAGRHSGLPPLRIYWYDGARDAVPTVAQRRLAILPDLKLRLGRIVRLTQKGVDSLLVSDLITLAHERAIVTAYVLTGDEDVREGIAAAQALGVRVVLVGIDSGVPNQARTLVREADELILLEAAFWARFIGRVGDAGKTDGEAAALTRASRVAAGVAMKLLRDLPPERIQELLAGHPVIPSRLDARLLRAGERALGSLRDRPGVKAELRAGFWRELRSGPLAGTGGAVDGPSRPAGATGRIV